MKLRQMDGWEEREREFGELEKKFHFTEEQKKNFTSFSRVDCRPESSARWLDGEWGNLKKKNANVFFSLISRSRPLSVYFKLINYNASTLRFEANNLCIVFIYLNFSI